VAPGTPATASVPSGAQQPTAPTAAEEGHSHRLAARESAAGAHGPGQDSGHQRHAASHQQTQPAGASTEVKTSVRQTATAPSAEAGAQVAAHRKEERERRKEEAVRRKEIKKAEHSRESGKHEQEGSSPSETVSEETSSGPTLAAPAPAGPVATIASTASSSTSAAENAVTGAPAVASVSPQALDKHRARVARHAATTPKHVRASDASRALSSASETLAAATSRPATHTGRGGSLAGIPTARKANRPSPLATTITRIVDVVPTPMRMLIALLAGLALALAVRSRLAALRARRLERQRGQLLEDVGLLQAALLPVAPERLGPVGTSAAYKPADGPGAGGDFYDVFALENGQLAVIVGDVSGHGRHALPHTALLRFTLRAYLEAGLSPRDAVQTAGAVLDRQLGGQFATVVAATYNPRERILVYACAGHPAPVVLGSQSAVSAIEPVIASSSPPIGVGMRTGIRQTVVSVPGGAQVCFYTDGVTEARVGGELFGAERLRLSLAELGSQASASSVLDSVVEQADARPDDMAACLLRVEGGESEPAVLVEELELDRDSAASQRTERFLIACGVEHEELAEVVRAARAAAGRDGTAVLELHRSDGPPRITLRRDHLRYLHVPQTEVEVSR
jgi:serine phosphatase RsbU (regulator of sigma subunit)